MELVGPMSDEKQLLYVGRRTISKYGCSGCHDIPGYEDVKPIGTGLADWGRKGADKLAFEQIADFMLQAHLTLTAKCPRAMRKPDIEEEAGGPRTGFNLDMPSDEGYFLQKLMHHEREGFIWNKLRAPRSYDYKKTENKGYNERLRMPKFNFTQDQVSEVITFVLGLVAEPPAVQYVYKPTPQRGAIIEGERLVEKFNCTGCHTLQMDKWNLAYHAADFSDPPPFPDYPFLEPHATPQQIKCVGIRNGGQAGPVARHDHRTAGAWRPDGPAPWSVDEDGASAVDADDTTTKAFYQFVLWDNALINGKVRQAGLQNLMVPSVGRRKAYTNRVGGYLARLIYPRRCFKDEKAINPNAKAEEAWGWLPPPLVNEGRKVRSGWLHDFLLNPYTIRPAVVLRMPRFNMKSSSRSRHALAVNYFAARRRHRGSALRQPACRAVRGQLSDSGRQAIRRRLHQGSVTDNNFTASSAT